MMLKWHSNALLRPSLCKHLFTPSIKHNLAGVGFDARSCALRPSESPATRMVIARADFESEIKETESQLGELEKLPEKEKRVEQLAFWVGSAVAFGAGIWYILGPTKGKEYFAGYLLGEEEHVNTTMQSCMVAAAQLSYHLRYIHEIVTCRTKLECGQLVCLHSCLQLLQDPTRRPKDSSHLWHSYCSCFTGCHDPAWHRADKCM